ncbi:MAG: hypothetical protein U0840_30895 [Gemmataceae bacterium]
MTWLLGIDEAGYGPNLGPFVMSGVLSRVEPGEMNLWQRLDSVVRKATGPRDDRLIVDDSKEVYSGGQGLDALERGLHALANGLPATLGDLVTALAPDDHGAVCAEAWYTGTTSMPTVRPAEEYHAATQRFQAACQAAGVGPWRVRSTIICPPRFNDLVARHDSKAAVLGEGFIHLLRWALAETGDEPLLVFVDKQGGRNSYAAQIQQAMECGYVIPQVESASQSRYQVLGLERPLELTFRPRADQEHFGVALASMVSKLLRELFMGEFNDFWMKQVAGLKPTAGYPADAPRFLAAIRPMARRLGIPEEQLWRCR